ncbi:MAG: hypothetical protein JRS35_21705 [Deltaproteobacteria bacterium]|nr:hypothetical protein [Deltaproteobacteria bacterium]
MTPEEDGYYVPGKVLAGLALLEGADVFASVIPEVRNDSVMSLARPKGAVSIARKAIAIAEAAL